MVLTAELKSTNSILDFLSGVQMCQCGAEEMRDGTMQGVTWGSTSGASGSYSTSYVSVQPSVRLKAKRSKERLTSLIRESREMRL